MKFRLFSMSFCLAVAVVSATDAEELRIPGDEEVVAAGYSVGMIDEFAIDKSSQDISTDKAPLVFRQGVGLATASLITDWAAGIQRDGPASPYGVFVDPHRAAKIRYAGEVDFDVLNYMKGLTDDQLISMSQHPEECDLQPACGLLSPRAILTYVNHVLKMRAEAREVALQTQALEETQRQNGLLSQQLEDEKRQTVRVELEAKKADTDKYVAWIIAGAVALISIGQVLNQHHHAKRAHLEASRVHDELSHLREQVRALQAAQRPYVAPAATAEIIPVARKHEPDLIVAALATKQARQRDDDQAVSRAAE